MKVRLRSGGNLSQRSIHEEMSALLHHSQFMDRAEYLGAAVKGLVLGDGSFVMTAFYVLPAKELPEALLRQDAPPMVSTAEIYKRILPMVRQRLGQGRICYTTQMDGWIVCLVCCLSVDEAEQRYQLDMLRAVCLQVLEQGHELTGLDFRAIVSLIVSDAQNLSRAYTLLTNEYEFLRFFEIRDEPIGGTGTLHGFPATGTHSSYTSWKERYDQAGLFYDCVLRDDEAGGLAVVEALLESLSALYPRSIHALYGELERFFDAVFARFTSSDALPGEAFDGMSIPQSINQSENRQELIRNLRTIGQGFFAVYRRIRHRTSAQRIQAVRAWLEAHLADPSLSVTRVAEQFSMSQPLMSAQFKRYCGISPGEYIEKQRVENARRYLSRTTLTLEEICRETGFGSVATLQRSFRKLWGETPGQYRARQKA